MLFSYNWLKDYLRYKISPEEIAELLNIHSFEVENLEKKEGDWIFDIYIFPNRAPDCMSHQGIAREINSILKFQGRTETKSGGDLKRNKFLNLQAGRIKGVQVKVENPKDCPRYSLMLVRDLAVQESPKFIRKRLKILGMEPINNVVDITNYVMLDSGQPLHAFDFDALKDKGGRVNIQIRRALDGEKIKALNGNTYNLSADHLVIASGRRILAVAGIKGALEGSINSKTKNILVEAANFNQALIYRAARSLALSSDASNRFSHGVFIGLPEQALGKAAFLFSAYGRGKVEKEIIDKMSLEISSPRIVLGIDKVRSLLGFKISKSKCLQALRALGFTVEKSSNPDVFLVCPPPFRQDIVIAEDLIEEIIRLYGYDNIKPVFPMVSLTPPAPNEQMKWRDIVRDFLTGMGFTEIYSYSLFSKEELELVSDSLQKRDLDKIKLANPLSNKKAFLRISLLPSLLAALAQNLKASQQANLFEIGKVFTWDKRKARIQENWSLALASFGSPALDGHLPALKKAKDFYSLKGILDTLMEELGIDDFWYKDFQGRNKSRLWEAESLAEIWIGDKKIGFLGRVDLPVLDKYKLDKRASLLEVNLDALLAFAREEREFEPPPKFPAVIRDISFLVDKSVSINQILSAIDSLGEGNIEDVDLFDIYEGRGQDNKKSLTFRIIYRSRDKTLTDEEVNSIHKSVERVLSEKLGAEIR